VNSNLGGRLPLVDADTLDGAQRELFDHLQATVVPWSDATGFRSTTADGKFIGPFNAALRSPAVAGAFLELQASEERHTSLSDRVRQVVILAVGAVWAADYEIYAHSAVARHCGIPDDAIRRLAAGTLPVTLSDEEKVAYRFAQKLSTSHRIDDSTFVQARKALETPELSTSSSWPALTTRSAVSSTPSKFPRRLKRPAEQEDPSCR
jgi:4-carboxymuconolactone decarboxylase